MSRSRGAMLFLAAAGALAAVATTPVSPDLDRAATAADDPTPEGRRRRADARCGPASFTLSGVAYA